MESDRQLDGSTKVNDKIKSECYKAAIKYIRCNCGVVGRLQHFQFCVQITENE